MPGPNIEEFNRQMQGVQLVSTHNQQRANRLGHGRANESRLIEREARRRARQYEIAEIGLIAYLKNRFAR